MVWITYAWEERPATLTGYHGRQDGVAVRLVTFDRQARMRRAGLGLATWWSVAVASVFVPVAHVVLVPGFVAFGIYSGLSRLREAVVVVSVRGTCPDCDVEQDFPAHGPWAGVMTIACGHCRRSLRLTADIAEEGLEPPTRGL